VAKTSALYHEKQKLMAAKAFKKKAEEEKESKEKVAPSKFKRPKLTWDAVEVIEYANRTDSSSSMFEASKPDSDMLVKN